MTQQLQNIIDAAWEDRANISVKSASREVADAVEHVISQLNSGALRVATREGVGQWTTHQWIKKAVLLSFRLKDNEVMKAGDLAFFDKVQTKFAHLDEEALKATGVRVVPPAVARRGSYLAKGVILMPSFVNIGAYVDEGTMVDSHALVGSCAQIGKRVHLSAGAQIGGVLEPAGALPVIIEDEALVGGNCGVYEGTVVRERAVLAPGTLLTGGTAVFDLVRDRVYRREGDRPLEIPAGAVVVPGTRMVRSGVGAREGIGLYAPVIVKYRDERTDAAVQLEDLLR